MTVCANLNDISPGVAEIADGSVDLDSIRVVQSTGGTGEGLQIRPNASRVILRRVVVPAHPLGQMEPFASLDRAQAPRERFAVGRVTGLAVGGRLPASAPGNDNLARLASGAAVLGHVVAHPARPALTRLPRRDRGTARAHVRRLLGGEVVGAAPGGAVVDRLLADLTAAPLLVVPFVGRSAVVPLTEPSGADRQVAVVHCAGRKGHTSVLRFGPAGPAPQGGRGRDRVLTVGLRTHPRTVSGDTWTHNHSIPRLEGGASL